MIPCFGFLCQRKWCSVASLPVGGSLGTPWNPLLGDALAGLLQRPRISAAEDWGRDCVCGHSITADLGLRPLHFNRSLSMFTLSQM